MRFLITSVLFVATAAADEAKFELRRAELRLEQVEVRLKAVEETVKERKALFEASALSSEQLEEALMERDVLRVADHIIQDEIRKAGLYDELWQSFGVLLPIQTVGVMGDERTYENVIAVRAVESVDAMTADFAHLSHDLLGRISNRLINEVRGINRVVYDISSKPPATIEWE